MCNCNKPRPGPKIKTPLATVNLTQKKRAAKTISELKPKFQPQITASDVKGETMEEKCLAFAQVLGLEKAVPEAVLIAALENPAFAKRLLVNRGTAYLYELINNPPESLYQRRKTSFSNTELIHKAGKALLKWGFSGFTTVSAETLKKREDACLKCPELIMPETALQKYSASAKITAKVGERTGNKICSACGCVVKNKMKLSTDTCPLEDLSAEGLNRWGEAVGS
jgi:hypothetical protein